VTALLCLGAMLLLSPNVEAGCFGHGGGTPAIILQPSYALPVGGTCAPQGIYAPLGAAVPAYPSPVIIVRDRGRLRGFREFRDLRGRGVLPFLGGGGRGGVRLRIGL
jgi:hypothetical protein